MTMTSIPRFAVVGHPNKGKSSIVATLSEDSQVAIARESGTTVRARVYPLRIDGETLYELIDTPGFQRARAVLEWLQAHERGASSRPGVLREFVTTHVDDPAFRNECELLRPIVGGAGILYVVDGARPYGREYEAEMEILRWSGQPRMALINLIGEGDHVDAWRRALDQYFALVRVFDAVRADFDRRIELLRAFGELHQPWAPQLQKVADLLVEERKLRCRRAAATIAALLCNALTTRRHQAFTGERPDAGLQERLVDELQRDIANQERECRRQVQAFYHHETVDVDEDALTLLASDLFSDSAFSLFGLSKTQLAVTGAATGAAAAAGIDLLAGGASLGLATMLGAVAGGVTTLVGAQRVATTRVLGAPLGGSALQVGPIVSANLPWVLLGRALLHHRVVAERNHAHRERMVLATARERHVADRIPLPTRQRLERCFRQLRDSPDDIAQPREALTSIIESLMADDR